MAAPHTPLNLRSIPPPEPPPVSDGDGARASALLALQPRVDRGADDDWLRWCRSCLPLVAPTLSNVRFAGFPLPFYFGAQGAILVYVALIVVVHRADAARRPHDCNARSMRTRTPLQRCARKLSR